jgi:hypothetical protein
VGAHLWMVDYRDEIDSDLSVFHRIDDPQGIPSSRYFRLAWHLASYDGAVAAAIRAEHQQDEPEEPDYQQPQAVRSVTLEGSTLAVMTETEQGNEMPGVEYTS